MFSIISPLGVFVFVRLSFVGDAASFSNVGDSFQKNSTTLLDFNANITLLESTTALSANQSKRHSTIVFPDSIPQKSEIVFPVDTSKCSATSTYCEDVSTYPHDHLHRMLSKHYDAKGFFGVDEDVIEHRIGDFEDNFICASIEKTIFPKAGKNKYNKWKYIVNQGDQEGYVQGIRIETCVKPNGACNLLGSGPYGYVTSCKQKYIYRRLLSVSDSGMPTADTFQIPSACCCSYRRNDDYLLNFGRKMSSSL